MSQVAATKRAQDFARQYDIDLSTIQGTGQGGKIIMDDVTAVLRRRNTDDLSVTPDDFIESVLAGIAAHPKIREFEQELRHFFGFPDVYALATEFVRTGEWNQLEILASRARTKLRETRIQSAIQAGDVLRESLHFGARMFQALLERGVTRLTDEMVDAIGGDGD